MDKEFVSYEQALALKELGFDEKCLSRYCAVTEWEELTGEILFQNIDCNLSERFLVKAPLKQQVFRWFREKYNMLACVYSNASGFLYEYHDAIGGTHRYDSGITGPNDGGTWDTYEEAENALIDKLIEIAKQQHHD